MFGIDAADSREASYEQHPVDVLESPDSPGFIAGLLKDAICRWRGDVPRTMAEMKAAFYLIIDEALRDSEPEPTSETLEAVAELLQRFASQPHGQLYAYAYLLVLNRCPYSEAEIARRLNCTKAAVSKIKRRIEDQLQLKSRVGRSEESCEKFRQLRIGKRKQRQPWTGASIFLQPA